MILRGRLGLVVHRATPFQNPESPRRKTTCCAPWIREEKDFKICMDRFPAKDPNISNTRHRELMGPDDVYQCRACDMSMGLGSASLTMEELLRAYSIFPSNGKLVEPYYIESVRDRDGKLLEAHEEVEHEQVVDPGVALDRHLATARRYGRWNRLQSQISAWLAGTRRQDRDNQ